MNTIIRITFVLLVYYLPLNIHAQIAINTDNSDPESSAMLDIKSTDKGMLIPRMTTTQRDLISSPATGLLVFDNTTSSFWFYDGTVWMELISKSPFQYDGTLSIVKPNAGLTNMSSDDFVFGSPTLDYDGNTNHANRFFFDKSKGAFRAGRDMGDWNNANVGNYSIAMGDGVVASGINSVSMGESNIATGDYSLSLGSSSTSDGDWSVSIGNQATIHADGDYGVAIGYGSTVQKQYGIAIGANSSVDADYAVSIGRDLSANSFAETKLGLFATSGTPISTNSFNALDRLFVIGNGTDVSNRSDALVMLKNGNTTLNGALTLNGGTNSYTFPTDDGTNEQILSTDGSGNLNWAADQDNQTIDDFSITGSTIILSLEDDDEPVKSIDLSSIDTDDQTIDEFSLLGTHLLLSLDDDDQPVKTVNLSPVITFETISNITSNNPGDYGNDDFVFGSPSLDDDGNGNHFNRFFFDKDKGAFRAGQVVGDFWDESNRGDYSFAVGKDTKASNNNAAAFGNETLASGINAAAFGESTEAKGDNSVTFGVDVEAPSYSEFVLGHYSTIVWPNSTNSINSADRLFTIGNGLDDANRSNALVMLKSGNTTLNGDLTINGAVSANNLAFETISNITSNYSGTYATDDFIFGSPSLNDDGNADHDKRFFFDKSKGAFRAGEALANVWNESNLGNYSFAIGYDVTASGENSFAFGEESIASGDLSFAGGGGATASGDFSFAFGNESTMSSGGFSFAFGNTTTASGDNAISFGNRTSATSFSETTIGLFSTEYTPTSATTFDSNDRLFTIGNGTSTSSRSDALVMLKNGNTTLNGDLTINGTISSNNLAFETTSNITSNSPGTYATDDFVFGSSSLDDDGNTDHNRRFFFDKSKGAFRAGRVLTTEWDESNLGNFSGAFGLNTTASGASSFASGEETAAINTNAVAFGLNTTASGQESSAFGESTIASGDNSTAFGILTKAEGFNSIAFGVNTTASGNLSTVFGNNTKSLSYSEFVIGYYSTDYSPNSTSAINSTDRLFTIGNGTSTSSRSDALIMLKNGNTTLNGDLTINGALSANNLAFETISNITSNYSGTYSTDDFVFGSPSLDDDGNDDHDRRFFFDKSKAAFRVGRSSNDYWDSANVGDYSFAGGNAAIASGNYSFAYGQVVTSSGYASFAGGAGATASGDISFAFGNETTLSSGDNSFAAGENTSASGNNAVAIGKDNKAASFSETTLGIYSTNYTPNSTTSFNSNDRLFTIGNGTSTGSRSDALVMLKNGNTTLNGLLTLNGGTNPYTFPADDGTIGQFLLTDGSGNLAWAIPINTDDQTIDVLNLSGTNLEISLADDGEDPKVLDLSPLQNAFKTTGNVTSNSVGSYMTDDFVFGSSQLDDDGNTDHDNRFFFDKSKAAFRAGEASGTEWDVANLGNDSFAAGSNTTASGSSSTAVGSGTSASAFGSLATGVNTTASAPRSAAFGTSTTASGDNAAVFGIENTSPSYSEFVAGMYNTNYTPNSTTGYHGLDRIFTIGNGENNANRSDAMIVYKNGHIGIGTDVTPQRLTVGELGDGAKGISNEWLVWSDRRLKRDFQPIKNPLEKLAQLNGYYYYWTKDKKDQSLQLGVIAQEVEAVLPEIVSTSEDDIKSVDYSKLTALLIEVNKEQETRIENQEARISALEVTLSELLSDKKNVHKTEESISKTK